MKLVTTLLILLSLLVSSLIMGRKSGSSCGESLIEEIMLFHMSLQGFNAYEAFIYEALNCAKSPNPVQTDPITYQFAKKSNLRNARPTGTRMILASFSMVSMPSVPKQKHHINIIMIDY